VAWAVGAADYVPFTPTATIADGIATVKPVRTAEVLSALRRSGGGVVAVAEAEIAPARAALGRLGLFVEPTAATAGAALSRLLRDGTIGADQTTVVVLTGHGLKATDKIAELRGLAGRGAHCAFRRPGGSRTDRSGAMRCR
jgi:threonine synthase